MHECESFSRLIPPTGPFACTDKERDGSRKALQPAEGTDAPPLATLCLGKRTKNQKPCHPKQFFFPIVFLHKTLEQ